MVKQSPFSNFSSIYTSFHKVIEPPNILFNFQAKSELEQQVRELREELMQSNSLRKQQLVELGLLREEEKQKANREYETTVRFYTDKKATERFVYMILCLAPALTIVIFGVVTGHNIQDSW